MRRRFWSICIAAALTAGGSAAAVAAAPAAFAPAGAQQQLSAAERWAASLPAPEPIRWGACSDASLKDAGATCGFLVVPLDWSRPRGATIRIAVSRVVHRVPRAQFQGVMVANPGGPGGSGLGLATLGALVPHHAGDAYDWIGFDPRGVGSSVPRLTCIADYNSGPRPQYVPRTPRQAQVWLHRSRTYAHACAIGTDSALLRHMRTVDVAKDVDYLRRALGRARINYYGFSYGTYLGQVYSTLFPSRVRRMVFDSTVDPRGFWYRDNLAQDIAFERNVHIWFGWVARHDRYYHLGTTRRAVRELWYREKTALAQRPAGGVVGADEWADIFLYSGYYQATWTYLGSVFAAWVHHHDTAAVVEAYQIFDSPTDDNGFAVYLAVQCTDAPAPTSWAVWRRDNWRVHAKAPFYTWGNAWFNGPCLYWPAPAHRAVRIDGRHVASVLMIDETLDAATPYPGSLYVRSIYPGARLIAEPGGTTHAGTLSGDACVDDRIAAYLASGTLPARRPGYRADAYCAPLPRPQPRTTVSTSTTPRAALRLPPGVRPLRRVGA